MERKVSVVKLLVGLVAPTRCIGLASCSLRALSIIARSRRRNGPFSASGSSFCLRCLGLFSFRALEGLASNSPRRTSRACAGTGAKSKKHSYAWIAPPESRDGRKLGARCKPKG